MQNTGHGDLVDTVDGGSVLVLLGVRPLGGTQAFSPLGRETFHTDVTWVDGWPVLLPVELAPSPTAIDERLDLTDPSCLDDHGWIAVRAMPHEVAAHDAGSGLLTLSGDGTGMSAARPAFIGRRQRHLSARMAVVVDATDGAGGLATRYDELHWITLTAATTAGVTTVTAHAQVAGLAQRWAGELPAGEVELAIEVVPPPPGFGAEAMGGDRISLLATAGDVTVKLTELDGRYWTAETAASFTGRVFGPYALRGSVGFRSLSYTAGTARAAGTA